MRHIQGDNRQQASLLPDSLEDYVDEDNPVRVIDAFVEMLDLKQLGFTKAETKQTGRKPYNPADLLKLYIYGYLHQIRTSRRLEKECHRNLELLWLMKRLAPDFKTIADFRKDNRKGVRAANRQFIQFCKKANLLSHRLVAIDGSKFRAAGSSDRCLNRTQLREQQCRIDRQVEQYLQRLDKFDKEDAAPDLDRERVQDALHSLKQRQSELAEIETEMDEKGSNQHCSTEPDAKRMRSGREGKIVGYNVQSAVDVDSGLIVHHEMTDESSDSRQLYPMAEAVKHQAEVETLDVVADAGYSNGEQLQKCDDTGIEAAVPPNRAINNQGDFYQKRDFHYEPERNCFICPAGEELHYTTKSTRQKHWLYSRTGCNSCPLQPKCTKADKRWITRHFHEDAFTRSEARLAKKPELMRVRMAAVERPFAVIKHLMGMRRFQCRGIERAGTEMALGVLSYNLKTLIQRLGARRTLELMAT